MNGDQLMNADELRKAYVKWITERKPNFFATFNFERRVGDVAAQTIIKNFLNRAQRAAYGRRWHNRPDAQKPVAVGFFEHAETNPHYHVLIHADPKMRQVLRQRGEQLWTALAPRGQFHGKPIDYLPGLLKYVTKELQWNDRAGSIFVYAPTRRANRSPKKKPPESQKERFGKSTANANFFKHAKNRSFRKAGSAVDHSTPGSSSRGRQKPVARSTSSIHL